MARGEALLHLYNGGDNPVPPSPVTVASSASAPSSIPILPTGSPEDRGQRWAQGLCSVGTLAGLVLASLANTPQLPALSLQSACDDPLGFCLPGQPSAGAP